MSPMQNKVVFYLNIVQATAIRVRKGGRIVEVS